MKKVPSRVNIFINLKNIIFINLPFHYSLQNRHSWTDDSHVVNSTLQPELGEKCDGNGENNTPNQRYIEKSLYK